MRRTLILAVLSSVLWAVAPAGAAEAAAKPRCHGEVATIVGTDGSDEIKGTPGRDVIVGGKGDDEIDGRGGADVICGQRGSDELRGGRGDDLLDGGRDDLYDDIKFGPELYGDTLVPGPGDDTIHPGWDRRQKEHVWSPDSVTFGGANGVTVRLGNPGRWGTAKGEGRDRILGQSLIEIRGTEHGDVITGADSDDTLIGNGGDDHLAGGAGDDRLIDRTHGERDLPSGTDVLDGGSGNDSLQAVTEPDRVLGGDGDDHLASAPGACVDHDGGGGQDQLTLEAGNASLTYDAGASAVDGAPVCGSATSTESASLSSLGTVSYRGTDGPDDVVVHAGAVTASLLAGDDTLRTWTGDDLIDAGAGIDEVDAHDGVDVCDNAETAHNCESGANLPVPSCEGRTATIVVTRSSSDWPVPEPVTGTGGDDVILGSEYDDVIDGGAGDDIICGGGGADRLTGGDGDDRLFGGLDAYERLDWTTPFMTGDTLVPGPGDDYLDGGWDADQLVHEWHGSTPDTLDYSGSSSAVTADLVAGTVVGQGTDTVRALPHQSLIATAHDDRITTGPSDDEIQAGDGADVIDSGAGDDLVSLDGSPGAAATDTVSTGEGDDTVTTENGADVITTGEGADSVTAGKEAGAVSVETGAGDDSVEAHSGALLDGGTGVDRIDFTAAASRGTVTMHARAGTLRDRRLLDVDVIGWEAYTFHSGEVPWRFFGTGRDEELVVKGARRLAALGRGGDDVLRGTSGRDRLLGGAGRDRAFGFGGQDVCVGFEQARSCERTR